MSGSPRRRDSPHSHKRHRDRSSSPARHHKRRERDTPDGPSRRGDDRHHERSYHEREAFDRHDERSTRGDRRGGRHHDRNDRLHPVVAPLLMYQITSCSATPAAVWHALDAWALAARRSVSEGQTRTTGEGGQHSYWRVLQSRAPSIAPQSGVYMQMPTHAQVELSDVPFMLVSTWRNHVIPVELASCL